MKIINKIKDEFNRSPILYCIVIVMAIYLISKNTIERFTATSAPSTTTPSGISQDNLKAIDNLNQVASQMIDSSGNLRIKGNLKIDGDLEMGPNKTIKVDNLQVTGKSTNSGDYIKINSKLWGKKLVWLDEDVQMEADKTIKVDNIESTGKATNYKDYIKVNKGLWVKDNNELFVGDNKVMKQSKKYRIVNYHWGDHDKKSWVYMTYDAYSFPNWALQFKYHSDSQGTDATKFSFESAT